ncbi:hypothetical protein [uncultured Pelagimonas sp.]|uniref:hypothetical protein n=1 Tax=uncultured Pelagimonas sp. TaxID=1618102 RepID=UPI00260A0D59|nr:hypothetical protein [uncultured Pelagimonas sp.]
MSKRTSVAAIHAALLGPIAPPPPATLTASPVSASFTSPTNPQIAFSKAVNAATLPGFIQTTGDFSANFIPCTIAATGDPLVFDVVINHGDLFASPSLLELGLFGVTATDGTPISGALNIVWNRT